MYTINESNTSDIAKDFLSKDLSLRLFAKEYCAFSYVTLSKKLREDNYPLEIKQQVLAKLNFNKTRNINEDIEAQQRVLNSVKLLLKEDLTVIEIAQVLNSTEMSIYRDLTKRLMEMKDIDISIKKEVLKKLNEHSRTKGGRHG